MMFYVLVVASLLLYTNADTSHCRRDPMCKLDEQSKLITCDGMYGDKERPDRFPILDCYPPVPTYLFRNFLQVHTHAFRNMSLPENEWVTIRLLNITTIDTEAFSHSLKIPANTKLSIEIGQIDSPSSLSLRVAAFQHIRIDRISFLNINNFNGRPIFDTVSLGFDVQIHELIFESCGITGFANLILNGANVDQLSIRNNPALTQIAVDNLPIFLSTTKLLEISNTGLQSIQPQTFQAWSLNLEELRITNNSNFKTFPSQIIDGKLIKLDTLDLSYNPIQSLDATYDWLPFSYAKHLILRNQQLDLFLHTQLLETLSQLETIDFSEGFISENNDDLIRKYFPNMTQLTSIDVSLTNLTENMIIDLLTHFSQSTTHYINFGLYGHTLSDDNFCSYFQIFRAAPNLFHLKLDEAHECNCVVDLFYDDQAPINYGNRSVVQPKCLSNSTRTVCDIDNEVAKRKCRIDSQNPGNTDSGNRLGNYAFGALVGGSVVAVVILLGLGFTIVYRIRSRRNTDVIMEQPVENPLSAIIEERTHSI